MGKKTWLRDSLEEYINRGTNAPMGQHYSFWKSRCARWIRKNGHAPWVNWLVDKACSFYYQGCLTIRAVIIGLMWNDACPFHNLIWQWRIVATANSNYCLEYVTFNSFCYKYTWRTVILSHFSTAFNTFSRWSSSVRTTVQRESRNCRSNST